MVASADAGVAPDAPPAVTPAAPAPGPEAARVAGCSRALDALPHPEGEPVPIPGEVVEPLHELREALDAYVLRAMEPDRCDREGADDDAVSRCLEGALRDAGVVFADAGREPLPWGALRSVRARAVPGRDGWRTVTATLRLQCGEDARVMLHARGRGPLIIEPAERLEEAPDARAYTTAWVQAPAGGAAPLLVLADQNEWCMSRWRTRRLRAFVATGDPSRPRLVWSHEHPFDASPDCVDDDDDEPTSCERLSVIPDAGGVTVAWRAAAFGRRPSGAGALVTTDAQVRLVRAGAGVREAWRRVRRTFEPW